MKLERVSAKIRATTLFLEQPLFNQPLYFMGKNLNPCIVEKFCCIIPTWIYEFPIIGISTLDYILVSQKSVKMKTCLLSRYRIHELNLCRSKPGP